MVVCAWAAIGATITPAMAAMANSLFRMVNSFARERRRLVASTHNAGANSSRAALFRQNRGLIRGISGEMLRSLEPIEGVSVLLFRSHASS
jgi:hypothetical protein